MTRIESVVFVLCCKVRVVANGLFASSGDRYRVSLLYCATDFVSVSVYWCANQHGDCAADVPSHCLRIGAVGAHHRHEEGSNIGTGNGIKQRGRGENGDSAESAIFGQWRAQLSALAIERQLQEWIERELHWLYSWLHYVYAVWPANSIHSQVDL